MSQKCCCCFPALSTTDIRSTPWAASDTFAHSIPLCRQTGSMGNQQIKNTGDKPWWKQRSISRGFLYGPDWSTEVAAFPISAHFALMHILPTQPHTTSLAWFSQLDQDSSAIGDCWDQTLLQQQTCVLNFCSRPHFRKPTKRQQAFDGVKHGIFPTHLLWC